MVMQVTKTLVTLSLAAICAFGQSPTSAGQTAGI